MSSSGLGSGQLLQDDDAGAFTENEAVTIAIPGSGGPLGLVITLDIARIEQNPAKASGVIAPSAPPAIAASA